ATTTPASSIGCSRSGDPARIRRAAAERAGLPAAPTAARPPWEATAGWRGPALAGPRQPGAAAWVAAASPGEPVGPGEPTRSGALRARPVAALLDLSLLRSAARAGRERALRPARPTRHRLAARWRACRRAQRRAV